MTNWSEIKDIMADRDYQKVGTSEQKEIAEKSGALVFEPKANELFLDIDSDVDFEHCKKHLKIFSSLGIVKGAKYSLSRSGNKHVFVTLDKEYDLWTRVAMQSAFGSDRNHESFVVRNILEKEPFPIMFFEVNTARTPIELA